MSLSTVRRAPWPVALILAFSAGCFGTTNPIGMNNDSENQSARIARLEQQLAALHAYIQQLHAALVASGAFTPPTPPPTTAPPAATAPAAQPR